MPNLVQELVPARDGANGGIAIIIGNRLHHGLNVVALSVALVAAGCASVPAPPLPSDDLREGIGTLGVVAFGPGDTAGPASPTKGVGEGAATGARQGAQSTYARVAEASCGTKDPSGVLCIVGKGLGFALAPIGAIVGAGIGAGRARSPEEVEATQASLVGVVEAATPMTSLRDRVAHYARRHVAVKALTEPAGSDATKRAGVNTVLELQPVRLSIVTDGEISPDIRVTLDVRGTLISATGARGLYIRSWTYRGEQHDYFDLGADNGAEFKAELERAYDRLAIKIVHDLFVATEPAPEEREEDGAAWALDATELVGWRARIVRGGTCFDGQKLTAVRLDGDSLLDEFTRRPLDRDSDLTFYPGRHKVALVCAEREQMGAFVKRGCGRLDFVAEPGVLYRPDWPAPNRLSLIEVHTGRAVGVAETWPERSGFIDSAPCEK